VFQQRIAELKSRIFKELIPLITSDYVLLNLPYYENIGDSLIWEGEEAFLSKLPYRCLYRSSIGSYRASKDINTATTVLMQGGGNFGDLWDDHQKFRLEVIQGHLNNPIIIFPVSVHYIDISNVVKDAERMARHKNLTICVRDQKSYDLLRKYFSNNILLLPDMAFCIEPNSLQRYLRESSKEVLLMKRTDKELLEEYDYKSFITVPGSIDILDWPTKQKGNLIQKVINRPLHRNSPFKSFADYYAYNFYRPYLIKKGVQFLSAYQHIYTTRLHGAILATLLQKPYTFFDNSYGKNKGFFDAWLSDLEGVNFIEGNIR